MNERVILTVNNVEIQINKYFAVAFSQMIYNTYVLDNNTLKIDIKTKVESQETYEVLKEILQYNKTEFECNDTISKDLFYIGNKLGIQELIDPYKTQVLDKNNCVQLLEIYFDICSDSKISECVDFISSHFYEIDQDDLKSISKKLGFDIIQSIFNNDKLLIKDEDSIANFIFSLINESEIFSPLVEYIHFEFCSEQVINKNLVISDENNYFNIIKSLHDSLLRSRNSKYDHTRYFIPSDYQNIFKYLDDLSRKVDQTLFETVCEDILNKNDDEFRNNILLESCEKGNLALAKSLIEHGCDKEVKNKNNQTPLHLSSFNGHLEVVQYLISNGADKEAKDNWGMTPLIKASEEGHLEVVQYLISNGADKEAKDNWGMTPLIKASEEGHLEVVQYLISNGADKEAKSNDGNTPLMCASIFGHLEVVKYLISVGADKEAKSKNGYTPLIIASANGHLEVVKYLISIGADKEAKSKNGDTPLIWASRNGRLEVVKYLISIGADKEAKSKNGDTPLIWASRNGRLEVVKYLISIGADKEAKSKNGQAAMDLAKDNVKKYLKSLE
ncbi:ankyrin repeat protein, putative [Trichomonas vaginalis G3]|uniref:Ankyrin repeat protein, putative n=1 Tax=Trichomonas vaginalis (strain ATCC PRA-98 / G3) TaxID=412133 RepID=A2ERS5_TRIV3|nr:ankyrin repeat, PH and SEC7 domain containing protein SECG-related family [Trichomonas vaginalis G3]EAY04656.1 ankyrin repeat protein, putative [Trichomonas vaginalis G3]KAI5549430.1 ankyrin repeat, PH and SEC7 domain containing protein SECG-related family [Trichomonas vaginalis G3]|eukprot:XP_001316879.1 ankyrin repeat protein [Trichomonas vaginalis G3]